MGKSNKRGKRQKICLTFDAEDRKEYLTGFGKRKQQRKDKAQKQIVTELKNEMIRIRKEKRDMAKKMMGDESSDDEGKQKEEDDKVEGAEVESRSISDVGGTTVEICGLDLHSSTTHLGRNKAKVLGSDGEGEETDELELGKILKKTQMREMRKSKLMRQKQRREGKQQQKVATRVSKLKLKSTKKKKLNKFLKKTAKKD